MIKSIIKKLIRGFSKIININPLLWMRIQQTGIKTNYFFDLKATNWIVRRPEWVKDYPVSKIPSIEPNKPSPGNKEINKRLISYYKSGLNRDDEMVDDKSIWGDYRQTLYRPLFEAFENDNTNTFMSGLFRSSAVNGYSYGSTFDDMPHRWAYLPIHIELSIVQLAEYLGVLRSECADQGEKAFWRKLKSPKQVADEIEQVIGFSIEHPRLGDARGIMFGGRFVTRETGSQIYTALRIAETVKRYKLSQLRVLEIGGGYGGLCYWLQKTLGDHIQEYNLIDIPEACIVQGFFLGEHHKVTLPNEEPKKDAINIRHHTDLDKISSKPNLVINQDSMPEMGWVEAERYVAWISENADGLFISFNQEAYSLNGQTGELQASVPEIASKFSNLERLERQYSWDRRGYVEEVYLSRL